MVASTASQVTADGRSRLLLWIWSSRIRLDLGACVLMLVLAFAFMAGGLPPGRVAAPMDQILVYPPWHGYYPDINPRARGGDVDSQQLPWREWAQQELSHGRFPLWISAPLGGYPLFANAQSSVLYPLHLLWLLMPIGAGFGIILALKLWLAGVGMWALLRAMGLHPAAALFGSLGLMFSAFFVNWLPWNHTSTYLLFPWMAWAAYTWWTARKGGSLLWLALFVGFAILGGHPETLFNISIALGVWMVGLLVVHPKDAWLKRAGGLALAVLLGFGIGAIQLLPFLESVGLSHQAAIRTPNASASAVFHLRPEQWLDWILPHFWSYNPDGVLSDCCSQYDSSYVGLIALMGVALLIIAALRRQLAMRLVLPWVGVGVFSWLVTYDVVVGGAIRSLPGFDVNVNIRWVSIVSFTALVLGAFGWDWLARVVERPMFTFGEQRRNLLGIGSGVLLIIGVVILGLHFVGALPPPELTEKVGASLFWRPSDSYREYWAIWTVGLAVAALGGLGLWVALGRPGASKSVQRIGPFVVGFVLLVDLWSVTWPFNPTSPASEYYPSTRFIRDVQSMVPTTERILIEDDVLPTNTAIVFNIRDWRVQDPMTPERAYRAALFLDPNLSSRGLDDYNMTLRNVRLQIAPLLGMRYFISPNLGLGDKDPSNPDKPTFTRLSFKEGAGLWEAQGVPGFAYLSDNVSAVGGQAQAEQWMKNVTWAKVRAYAAMVEAPASAVSGIQHDPAGASPGNASVTDYTPGHIKLTVNALRTSLLVVAESYYPGWHATIDGKETTILRADYLSQGVVTPAGQHTVEFNYEPEPFRYGAIVSILSVLALGVWVLGLIWLRRHRRNA